MQDLNTMLKLKDEEERRLQQDQDPVLRKSSRWRIGRAYPRTGLRTTDPGDTPVDVVGTMR